MFASDEVEVFAESWMFDGLQPLKPSKDADGVRSQRQTVGATLLAAITRRTEGDRSELSLSQRPHLPLKSLMIDRQHPTTISVKQHCNGEHHKALEIMCSTLAPKSILFLSDKRPAA